CTLLIESRSCVYLVSQLMTPVFDTIVPLVVSGLTRAVTVKLALSPPFMNPSLPCELLVSLQSMLPLDPTDGVLQVQAEGLLMAMNCTGDASASVKCGVSAVGGRVVLSCTPTE